MDRNIYIIVPKWGRKEKEFSSNDFFINQAIALKKNGENVIVVAIKLKSIKSGEKIIGYSLHNHYKEEEIDIFIFNLYVPIPFYLERLRNVYISRYYYVILRDYFHIKNNSCNNIIHAHVSHECAYYCLYASKKLNIPLVITEHYSGYMIGTATKQDFAKLKRCIQLSNQFIFVGSRFQQKMISKLSVDKVTNVIPNMVDLNLFTIRKNSDDCFTFLAAGSLKKNKSFDLVIRAFHLAFPNDNTVHLNIAGNGVERDSLVKITSELNEENRISFLGGYTKEKAKDIFSSANVFVLTSQIETFGIVYVEAMLSGLPCIGTKGQGGEDIIENDSGFLVPYGDVQELANKMIYIKNNYQKYNKENIRERAIERFSTNVVTNKLRQVYDCLGDIKDVF